MAQLREIKKRIKAVHNIRRITKTMQMIATAKFQAAIRRTEAAQPYTRKLSDVVGELAATAGDSVDHPLLHPPAKPANRELVLVVTSNRGLAGAYNSNILRTALNHIKQSQTTRQVDLEVVGKKGVAFFRFAGQPVSRVHNMGDKPVYEDVEKIAADYITRFEAGQYDAVTVIFMRFISNARQLATVLPLLPLQPPSGSKAASSTGPVAIYEFRPDAATLLTRLLPLTVKSALFQAFMEAAVSEHIARMVAMKSATDNAGKMGRSLKRSYNRARQAQITTELSEIISGAAALA
jgi:F-type H+-transporting ATPase subunit gamma